MTSVEPGSGSRRPASLLAGRPPLRHSRAGGNPRTNPPRRNVKRDSINYIPTGIPPPTKTPEGRVHLWAPWAGTRQTPTIPASIALRYSRAPTSLLPRPPPFVIPAKAGIQAPSPRERTPIAIPPTKSA